MQDVPGGSRTAGGRMGVIDHDKFLRHLVAVTVDMALADGIPHPSPAWIDARIAEARATYQPAPVSPQAAEHEVDVRYHRGCMR